MEIGQKVQLHSHDGFRRFVTIDRIITVQDYKLDFIPCYETNEGLAFYMTPDPETGNRFNVGNKAFWISKIELKRYPSIWHKFGDKDFL